MRSRCATTWIATATAGGRTGSIFEAFYADGDLDGFGAAPDSVLACDGAPMGYVAVGTDCDGSDDTSSPSAVGRRDEVDQGCDGGSATGGVFATVCPELDLDGVGDIGRPVACRLAPRRLRGGRVGLRALAPGASSGPEGPGTCGCPWAMMWRWSGTPAQPTEATLEGGFMGTAGSGVGADVQAHLSDLHLSDLVVQEGLGSTTIGGGWAAAGGNDPGQYSGGAVYLTSGTASVKATTFAMRDDSRLTGDQAPNGGAVYLHGGAWRPVRGAGRPRGAVVQPAGSTHSWAPSCAPRRRSRARASGCGPCSPRRRRRRTTEAGPPRRRRRRSGSGSTVTSAGRSAPRGARRCSHPGRPWA